mmetsp:Transcript_35795/g.89308  ORF Transcript_35795/g.89308 Transcript_35795/m.89308 type:complete len:136 (+) Transcript_35795:69-476(+)
MLASSALRRSSSATAGGERLVGRVCRLVKDGVLVQIMAAPTSKVHMVQLNAQDKVQVPHPPHPARRLMIHDDVELTKGPGGEGWLAAVLDDAGPSQGRTKTGLPHLDNGLGGGGGGKGPQLLSDLHGWKNKKGKH